MKYLSIKTYKSQLVLEQFQGIVFLFFLFLRTKLIRELWHKFFVSLLFRQMSMSHAEGKLKISQVSECSQGRLQQNPKITKTVQKCTLGKTSADFNECKFKF